MLFIIKMIYQTHDNRWLFFATLTLIFSTSSLVYSSEPMISLLKFNGNESNDSNEKLLPMTTQSDTLIETTVVSNSMDESTTNASATGLYLTTESTINNSTTTTSPLVDNLMASGSETRFRWMDFRRPQSYPPRMPALPGIPSGFRNPAANNNNININNNNNNNNPVFNPGMPFTGFGGSSTQPVGFGGSVVMSNHFGPQASSVRRPALNITRVEHITAECSDEYMKVSIHFNGTFTGLVYSSGYVHDVNCIYVNGSGRNHYEFFIRLNQCGTLGRQEMYNPTLPGEARRRDQLMWNTLSIQYNSLIEEEFDEHYRVTCEYGSDFWKTVTFPAVNVEVNTGSPVVFTINPPQCQMEIRRGFGIAGTRTSGPVTVGDPLTLLIHMKSEKTGFDILVKNCVAHNGAQQRLQLIDSSGCVTNEKLISPFRGTFNSENGHQVSLYSYLKAFRFTGSPALYLECDIHMCHNKCPPQRCYWRNLSKRSVDSQLNTTTDKPIVSESISLFQSLEVRQESDKKDIENNTTSEFNSDVERSNLCFRSDGVAAVIISTFILLVLSFAMSIGCCMKMRRMKYCQRHMIDASSLYKNSYDTIYSYPHNETLHSRRF